MPENLGVIYMPKRLETNNNRGTGFERLDINYKKEVGYKSY